MIIKLFISILLIMTVSCSFAPEEQKRSYEEVIEMIPDQNLGVHLEYIGKSPDDTRWAKAHDFVDTHYHVEHLALLHKLAAEASCLAFVTGAPLH